MTQASAGPPGHARPAGLLAGGAAIALGLAGLLLPASSRAAVTPATPPCTSTAPGPAADSTLLCLSVTRTTKADRLLPGHDADFTIQVWLAAPAGSPSPSPAPPGTATATPATPAAAAPVPATPAPATPTPATPPPTPSPGPATASVSVTLAAPAGGPVPRFVSCPGTVSGGACPLGVLTAGQPASTVTADMAIPATAAAGQEIAFTVATTDSAAAGTPASPQTFTVAAPPVPASPAATSPAPARTPAATGHATNGTAPAPAVGATLPAGLATPAAVPALGPLPGPAATGPAVTFPVVTPGPSQVPSPAAARPVPLSNVSEQFTLAGNQLGLRFGGIALAAALTCLGTGWLSWRRRPLPGPSRTAARGPRRRS